MRFAFLLIPAVLLIPAGIYFYFFFTRFLSLFKWKKKEKRTRIFSVLFAVICVAEGAWVFGLGAVIVYHFLVVCLLMELINWILRRIGRSKSVVWSFLYRSGIIGAVVILSVFVYGSWNMQQIIQKDYNIVSDKLEEGEKLDIAVISDLHMGTTMDIEKLRDQCIRIEGQKPDLLLLAGDIFDEHTPKSQMQEAAAVLAEVDSTYGTYYVFGNHDSNHYRADAEYTAGELKETLLEAGAAVLEDENVRIGETFCLIGRRDASDRERAQIGELTENLPDNTFRILLDHQPGRLSENEAAGIDLQISGHTHAGQIWPTGALMQIMGVNEINYGYRQTGDMQVIVSSGIAGWGYAVRTGGHSEFVMIHLASE